MAKYKLEFIDIEKNKFNIIENEEIRKNCMSIYMYMLKLNDKQNKEYDDADLHHLKDTSKYTISFKKFLKLYNRGHEKITLTTLKNRISLLEQYELITINKSNKVNVYSFCRYELTNELSNKLTDVEPTETIEPANVEADTPKHKYLNTKSITKDLDSNSNSTVTDNFDYDNYIQDNEKIKNWDYINELLVKAFKMLKVRSNWIKGEVISKLFQYYTNITKKHAMKYICTAIGNAREQYYSNYNKYVSGSTAQTTDNFNNYPQRTYDFDNLERQLLGWQE